jgi:hypothetical protein
MEELAKWELNGREIKNAIKTGYWKWMVGYDDEPAARALM